MNNKTHYKKKEDNFSFILGTIIFFGFVFVLGLIGIKSYISSNEPKVHYVNLETININVNNLEVKTGITIRANQQGEQWLMDNKKEVKAIFESALYNADIQDKNNVERMGYLSTYLKKEINDKLPEPYIKEILFTDFLTGEN